MTISPINQLRQSAWLAAIPDTIDVPMIGNSPARKVPIDQASIDDIAFALITLDRERSALMGTILALEDTVSMARKQGAAGSNIAVIAAARQLEARK